MKSLAYLAFPALLTFILLIGWQNARANHAVEPENVSNMVIDTLIHTEEAIALLRINPDSAKAKVSDALNLIKNIDAHYEHNTVASLEKLGSTVTATDYRHYYPRVDLQLLSNKQELPTLNYKLDSDIVYQGSDNHSAAQNDLYFDYTFAKASLVTARDAIDADHALEAMANLRRVFEAIYVNPDFNVSPTINYLTTRRFDSWKCKQYRVITKKVVDTGAKFSDLPCFPLRRLESDWQFFNHRIDE